MLPEGWSEIALEDLANVERGKFSARPRNDPKFYNGTTPFVQTGDVSSSDTYLREYTQTLNDEGVKVSKTFPKGTILVTIAANIGDSAIAEFDVACPDSVVGIQCYQEKSNNIWLKFKIDTIKKNLDNEAGKNAQKNINLQLLKPLKILTPPLPEQEKIAAVLSTWDKAISTTDALLANCRQQKKALMQQLLTGKRRLPGFTGEWKVVRAGSVLHEEGARNRGSKITRVLSVTNQKGFVLPEEQFSKRVASDNIENYKIIKRGQFGYNPSRLNVGSFGRLDTFEEGILSPLYVIFSIKDEYIDSDFFLAWMHSGETRQRIKGSTQGSVRESVSFNALASFPLNLPPLDEQRAIAAVLDAADREIVLLEQKAACLREEKKALMQQLLTGKRRVRL